jgi:hypothetical protein
MYEMSLRNEAAGNAGRLQESALTA